jgi:hypothetical protein
MAIVVSSIAELQRVMMEQVKEAMDESVEDLKDEIKESIDEVVYDYQPERYERTKTLKDSLAQIGSSLTTRSASITVGHDTSQMDYFSVQDGSRRIDIPEIVTYGAYGTFKGQGVYAYGSDYHDIDPSKGREWSKPRDYMAHAEQKLEGYGYLRKCLANYLPPHIIII